MDEFIVRTRLDVYDDNLANVLNELNEDTKFTHQKFSVPMKRKVTEILPTGPRHFTVVYRERNTDWIVKHVREYLLLKADLRQAYEEVRDEDRMAAQNVTHARAEYAKNKEKEWNSRSVWYRFWNEKPDFEMEARWQISLESYSCHSTRYNLSFLTNELVKYNKMLGL